MWAAQTLTPRAAAALALLCSLWGASPQAHAAVTLGEGIKGMACVVNTIFSVLPIFSLTETAVVTATTTVLGVAVCPENPHVDDYVRGCYPQLGYYSSCQWAAGNATQEARNVQAWLSSGRAANGTQFSTLHPGLITDGEARLTCVFIVAQQGMDSPLASWGQGNCVTTVGPPPPPPPGDRNVLLDPPHTGPPRLMVVGDSISHGKSGDYTWRYRLHEHLRKKQAPFDFVGPFKGPMNPNTPDDVRDPGLYKVQGWDDDHDATWGRPLGFEKDTIEGYVRTYQPDLVIVDLGTNDLTWFWDGSKSIAANSARVAGYMREFIQNARRARSDVNFLLVQTGATGPLEAHGEPRPYNDMLAALASELHTPSSRIHIANVAERWSWQTDTYDQTHPNVRGEHVIAQTVADTLWNMWKYGGLYGNIPSEASAPPKPQHVLLSPDKIKRNAPFTVSWDRVQNPGVWTEYKVQVRYHQAYGFGLVWESPTTTSNLSMVYGGPTLPQIGVFHVVVVAVDQYGQQTMSDPVPLTVADLPVAPPKVANLHLAPQLIGKEGGFVASWDRVFNPGVWTEYKLQLRNHHDFGFALVWQSTGTTPNLSLTYDGPRLPQSGVYDVVVIARDIYGQETMSEPVPLSVQDQIPPPLPVNNLRVQPNAMLRNGSFTATWDRVPNPKVWTQYKLQLRTHQSYGFKLLWESATTADLSVTYNGPVLPQTGTYALVVVARDAFGQETISAPVSLNVQADPPAPPPATNIRVLPNPMTRSGKFTVAWDRVVNPGIWTTYKIQLRNHFNYGFGLLWESPATANLSLTYTGPALANNGVYNVVVVSQDTVFGGQTMSEPIPLSVMDVPAPPAAPAHLRLLPDTISRSGPFSAVWDRVNNPGIWTTYKLQLRYHQAYGFGLIWESALTPDLQLKYTGPALPQAGVFQVVVVAHDTFGQEKMSAPVALTVSP